MSSYYDVELATDGTSSTFMASGYVDFWIIGLLAGSVKLQVLFNQSGIVGEPVWKDYPDGSYTADVAKTLYVGEEQVLMRVVGSGNTNGVYVRFGRS